MQLREWMEGANERSPHATIECKDACKNAVTTARPRCKNPTQNKALIRGQGRPTAFTNYCRNDLKSTLEWKAT